MRRRDSDWMGIRWQRNLCEKEVLQSLEKIVKKRNGETGRLYYSVRDFCFVPLALSVEHEFVLPAGFPFFYLFSLQVATWHFNGIDKIIKIK